MDSEQQKLNDQFTLPELNHPQLKSHTNTQLELNSKIQQPKTSQRQRIQNQSGHFSKTSFSNNNAEEMNYDGKNYSAAGTVERKIYGLDSTPQKSKSLLGSKQQQKDL
jgi:hypothetical protein